MREIKFRAWDKINKKMTFHDIVSMDEVEGVYKIHSYPWPISDLEIMQYTGLKDKNGVEIYEGDILDKPDPNRFDYQNYFFRAEVRFGEYDDSDIEYGSPAIGWYLRGYHGYNRENDGRYLNDQNTEHNKKDTYLIDGDGLYDQPKSILEAPHEAIVIGNIYQNPELLEVK